MSATSGSVQERRWQDAEHFRSHITDWANRIEVRPKSIQIRPMKNKWGSCSTRGHVSFNTRLLEEDQTFGEYVIVHELLHLRIPNHGKLFKSFLRAYLPDWQPPFDENISCGISSEISNTSR